jgi:hypothetical protein
LHEDLIRQYGTPLQNPVFWASVSPNTYLSDLSGPLQLHHDLADGEVLVEFSQELYNQAKQAGKTAELYTYPGDDHNLASSLSLAMQRTIAFFDKYVKIMPRVRASSSPSVSQTSRDFRSSTATITSAANSLQWNGSIILSRNCWN